MSRSAQPMYLHAFVSVVGNNTDYVIPLTVELVTISPEGLHGTNVIRVPTHPRESACPVRLTQGVT